MKRLLPLLFLASFGLAQVQIQIQVPPPPVITVSTEVRVSLVPSLVVIEREPQPQGIVVVYRSSRAYDVYRYHHRDLVGRGWVRVKYQGRGGFYKSEYRRGRAKAKLEVRDRRGRVEVKVREG
ncbi:MAG: hypothetical protein C4331_15305 [Meiothermus sp.]